MPQPPSLRPMKLLPPVGYALYGGITDASKCVFYPEVTFLGKPVSLVSWVPSSAEAIASCSFWLTGGDCQEIAAYVAGERSRSQKYSITERRNILASIGLMFEEPGVYRADIHVDLLDKVEGPAPEGRLV